MQTLGVPTSLLNLSVGTAQIQQYPKSGIKSWLQTLRFLRGYLLDNKTQGLKSPVISS